MAVLRLVAVVICSVLVMGSPSIAQDPGLTIPPGSEAHDLRAGSILFYPIYSSDTGTGLDTRITLTNHSTTSAAFVRLFFVDGTTGNVASAFRCLTSTQTTSFFASEVRPGVTGYLVGVATNGVNGCPMSHNFLTGQAHVQLATGHRGSLDAVSITALYMGSLPGCDGNSTMANLAFDGVGHGRVPRVLALSNFPSRGDGGRTLLVVNRVGGNLLTGVSNLGPLGGSVFDDAENFSAFGFTASAPQFRGELSNAFPITVPPFETFVPAGSTGWLKFFSQSDLGLLGSAFFLSGSSGFPFPSRSAGGQQFGAANLPALTLSAAPTYVMPVSAPSC